LTTPQVHYQGNAPGACAPAQSTDERSRDLGTTEAELRFGLAKLEPATRLAVVVAEFLLRVEVLAWNSEAARHYARLRATLEKQGEPMDNLDRMIAAQALAVEAILVTHDRVFRSVKGRKIEDWTKA